MSDPGDPSDRGDQADLPLTGVTVLDFSTLLPGPLCSLLLAEAGADVLKVERPGGDPMRGYAPHVDDDAGVRFLVLNRGKRSVTLDLKDDADRDHAADLAAEADVVLEQFRPGVMARLGLGYEAVSARNPGVVYCSVTGYGQSGPDAGRAGHDLNYVGDTGLLTMVTDDGRPRLPPATLADIAGGSYPAFMNILLALMARERTGRGAHLDVAMTENALPLVYWAYANGSRGRWPEAGGEVLTGGSPRYQVYATADGAHLAVAAIEERFWQCLCDHVGLPADQRNDTRDPTATRDAVAALVAARPLADWAALVADDACTSVVRTPREARAAEHLLERGAFDRRVATPGGHEVEAMHVPIVPALRRPGRVVPAAGLGPAGGGSQRPRRLADYFMTPSATPPGEGPLR